MEIKPTAQPEVKYIKLNYMNPPCRSHSREDNIMYWGIMQHDKNAYRFKHGAMTLGKMSEHLSRVAPAKIT